MKNFYVIDQSKKLKHFGKKCNTKFKFSNCFPENLNFQNLIAQQLKLKGLMKILPEQDEIEMLKSWDGDTKKLGNAEKFILQLISVKK